MGPLVIAPIVAGGVLLVGGVALRVRALGKKKAAANTPPIAAASADQVAQAAQSAGISVQQLTAAAASVGTTPAVFVASAINAGNSVADALINPSSVQAPISKFAVVTTHDQPPSGDLAVRATPSNSAPIEGAADKGGTVTVLNPDSSGDGQFAEIQWDGGRNPAIRGHVHKAFLALQ